MGQIPPPPPQLPENPMAIYLGLSPILPPVPLDLACDGHREAWSRYEAEREYEAWQSGEDYVPTPTAALWLFGGKITHSNKAPEQYVLTEMRRGGFSLLMPPDLVR